MDQIKSSRAKRLPFFTTSTPNVMNKRKSYRIEHKFDFEQVLQRTQSTFLSDKFHNAKKHVFVQKELPLSQVRINGTKIERTSK